MAGEERIAKPRDLTGQLTVKSYGMGTQGKAQWGEEPRRSGHHPHRGGTGERVSPSPSGRHCSPGSHIETNTPGGR